MSKIKIAIALVILAGIALMGFQDQLVNKIMTQRISERLNNVPMEQFTDTLSVVICGW